MTPNDFATALHNLKWKQADFCRKSGVHPNTTTNWLKGKTPIPAWVPAYLGAMHDIQRLHQTYVATASGQDREPRTDIEGDTGTETDTGRD